MTLAKSIPDEVVEILGPPPLLPSEDDKLYHATLERFAKDIAPTDIVTWLLIKDLVDYRVEIARCRRLKAAIIEHAHHERINAIIEYQRSKLDVDLEMLRARAEAEREQLRTEPHGQKRINTGYARIEAKSKREAAAKQEECEITIRAWGSLTPNEMDFAITLPAWITHHDKVDRLLEIAERRFFATLREIERHIFGFAKALREELKIIEGEVLETIVEKRKKSFPA